jgi:hypothetical protein
MRAIEWIFNWFYLLLALYCSVSPLAFWVRRLRDHSQLRLLALPIITLPASLIMLTFMIIRIFVAPRIGLTSSQSYMRYKEVGELTLAFGICVFAWLNWRWLTVPSEQAVMAPAGKSEVDLQPKHQGTS